MLVYAISFLLLRALSRYREFAADRGSAILTGRPSALASALMKISGTIERVPTHDLRRAEGMSAFFIVPARTKKSLMNLFADHPPLEQRLAALERLEAQLQGTAGTASIVGLRDILAGRSSVKPTGARSAVRALDGVRDARDLLLDHLRRRRRDRVPGARHQRLPVRAERHRGGRQRHRRGHRHDRREPRRRVRIPLGGRAHPDQPSVEDLAVGINAVSSSIEAGGYGERLLCAVFAFETPERAVNFIYNYKRGSWYPFVPASGDGSRQRAHHRARAAAEGADGRELPIEPELERWFPLWGVPF